VDEIARNFCYCIENARLGVRIFSPLEGLSSALSNIDLGDGLKIKKYTKNQMLRIIPLKFSEQIPNFSVWEHAVEHKAEYSIGQPTKDRADQQEQMKRVIRALRLLKPGKVAAPTTHDLPIKPGFIQVQYGSRGSLYKNPIFYSEYRLLPSEEQIVKKLLTALGNPIRKQTMIAIDRIDMSIERRTSEDELIDHIIALEALFGDRDTAAGSFTYKIALRAAMFMNDTTDKRTKEYRLLKKALGLRGKIVHGASKLNGLNTNEKEAVDWLAQFARKSISKILVDHPKFNENTADDHIMSLPTPI
jgi:hypothetical protein